MVYSELFLVKQFFQQLLKLVQSHFQLFQSQLKYLEIDDKDFLSATEGSYKLSIKFTDFYKKGEPVTEYVLHCSNSGHPTRELYNRNAAGYVFIENVSGQPKTMRLKMKWDNDSNKYSRKDIETS